MCKTEVDTKQVLKKALNFFFLVITSRMRHIKQIVILRPIESKRGNVVQ